MRAIVKCATSASKEKWMDVLKHPKVLWWPSIDQSDDVVAKQKREILDLVADEDRSLVERSCWFVIYSTRAKSWGLVSSPQDGFAEIRIRNQEPRQLRRACEDFIGSVAKYGSQVTSLPFDFPEVIEVLEPNSQHLAFYGEPLPPSSMAKWQLARRERTQEWRLAKSLLIAAVLLAIGTSPPFADPLVKLMTSSWHQWLEGGLGRLATSALVTGFVAGLTVLGHYFQLHRSGSVRWLFKT